MKKRYKWSYHDDSFFHHARNRNPDFGKERPITYSDSYKHDGYDNTESVKKALDLAMKWIKQENPDQKVTLKSKHFNIDNKEGKNEK